MNSIQSTAFCLNQPLAPQSLFHRHRSRLAPPAASAISIDYDDESKHHTITIPSFLSDDESDISGTYPSLLHKIHVLPFLEPEESDRMLKIARAYAEASSSWDQQDSTRHVSYQTVDFAVEESVDMSQYLQDISFQERIFGLLSEEYDVDVEDLSFLDLFCASYEASGYDDQTDRETMDRLDFHRDGSLLSFTVLLSQPEDFEGGGTIFDALRDAADESDQQSTVLKAPGSIQPLNAGYATLHSGKLLHGGHVVTKGQRIVLVGFVDVDLRNMREGALGSAAKEWGRNDVREFWNQRRLKQQKAAWNISNMRYLPKKGRSCLGKCSMPASLLESIENRSNPEIIRERRLRSEDRLLRDIMLPRAERGEKIEEELGEWREVSLEDMDGLMIGWEE
eukprot:scaffold10162_cov118-Skeletonema_dohrnii-CCMP3373.AAC.3